MRVVGFKPPRDRLDRSVRPPRTPLADLELAVVTPLFGGGAIARVTDPDWPIRAAAIRGQLRFWWRACNARSPRYPNTEELYKAESRFWGATPEKGKPEFGPAAIGVAVTVMQAGQADFRPHSGDEFREPDTEPYRTWRRNARGWYRGEASDPERLLAHGPDYALFPFQGTEDDPDPIPGREEVRFRLTLTLSPHVADDADLEACKLAAEQALWAWIAFGGIGARTRRGCGTLLCANSRSGDADAGLAALAVPQEPIAAPTPMLPVERFLPDDDIADWLWARSQALVLPGDSNPLIPSLHKARVILGTPSTEPVDAWAAAVRPLFEFCQGRGHGRARGGQRPGQSNWPEPGSVRGKLKLSNYNRFHPQFPYRRFDAAADQGFPRIDLHGLPQIFQQMPEEPSLEGAADGAKRMASPVIVKALPTRADFATPLVLVLNAPHVWDAGTPGVTIGKKRGERLPLDASLHLDGRGKAWRPASLMGGRTSARDAFLDWLTTAEWAERDNWGNVQPLLGREA